MTSLANPSGYHTNLSEYLIKQIIEATPKLMIVNQIAGYCGIPKSTLGDWLKRGAKEGKEGKDTLFAQLSAQFHTAKAKRCHDLLMKVEGDQENMKAYSWLLEKCFREDFGAESQELRELRDLFEEILPIMKGAKNGNGKEKGKEGQQEESGSNGSEETKERSTPRC